MSEALGGTARLGAGARWLRETGDVQDEILRR
jgi:hypothetical protein